MFLFNYTPFSWLNTLKWDQNNLIFVSFFLEVYLCLFHSLLCLISPCLIWAEQKWIQSVSQRWAFVWKISQPNSSWKRRNPSSAQLNLVLTGFMWKNSTAVKQIQSKVWTHLLSRSLELFERGNISDFKGSALKLSGSLHTLQFQFLISAQETQMRKLISIDPLVWLELRKTANKLIS